MKRRTDIPLGPRRQEFWESRSTTINFSSITFEDQYLNSPHFEEIPKI